MFIALFKFIDTHAQRNHCRKCNEQKAHVETKQNETNWIELKWIEKKKKYSKIIVCDGKRLRATNL